MLFRSTHRERSQNRRVIAVGLLCLAALIGIAIHANAQRANAAPAAPTTAASTISATYDDVPISYKRWYGRDVCIRDNSWGTFYPAVMEQIASQLDAPLWTNTRIFNAQESPDICANQFLDRQIIRFGLIPSQNAHLYNWCANTNSVNTYPYPGSASVYYGSHVELYWNYYADGCKSGNYIKRGREIGRASCRERV